MNTISIIGLIFSGVMLLISLLNLVISNIRNLKKDTEKDGQERAFLREGILKANVKLEQICSTTTATQSEVKDINRILQTHGERIIVLEKDVEILKNKIKEAK